MISANNGIFVSTIFLDHRTLNCIVVFFSFTFFEYDDKNTGQILWGSDLSCKIFDTGEIPYLTWIRTLLINGK